MGDKKIGKSLTTVYARNFDFGYACGIGFGFDGDGDAPMFEENFDPNLRPKYFMMLKRGDGPREFAFKLRFLARQVEHYEGGEEIK